MSHGFPYHARMDRWAVEIGVGLGALTVARGFRALIAAAVNGVASEGDCFFRRNRRGRFYGAVRGFTRRSVLALAKMPLFADLQFQSFGASLAEAAAGVSVLAQVIAKGL
jgi:hypothetical protein